MKYIIPCVLFLANSEVISLIALAVISVMFLVDIANARERRSRWE